MLSPKAKSVLPPQYATDDQANTEKQAREQVDIADIIVREEEERVRLNPVFNGIDIREDQFFKFDKMRVAELKKALKTEEVLRNPELKEALEKEINGYGKKDMTKEEI
jgi:hypothetical protein